MIGVFDSGVGGMTVAHAIEQALPEYRLVYFGDLARTPYGSKSPETIIKYSREDTEFLLEKGAKIIIIACNTAASVASDLIQREYPVPVFDVIVPAVARAKKFLQRSKSRPHIGVIGTRATIKSGIYPQLIREALPAAEVYSRECPLLVPLVEEGWLHKRETKMILRRYLHPLRVKQVQALVLGCTHYPLLKGLIQPRIGKRVQIIDSSEEVAAALKYFLEANPREAAKLSRDGTHQYYVSDVTDSAKETAHQIFGRPIDLIKA